MKIFLPLCLLSAGALGQAHDAAADIQALDRVTVRAERVSTLPTAIPTTIEGISAERIDALINASDSADALKYLPSLLVRKRYVGDYDHAVLSTRASGTGNSARSLVFADGILLSNLLGNGASFTPRWGLVTPEEIERVDVLYGPFSAAYSGNSVGAVVDIVTRLPTRFEAHAKLSLAQQHYDAYQTDDRPSSRQASVALGDRASGLAWWINLSRQHSQSHPLVYTTRTPSAALPVAGATVVSGAVSELNRFKQPWLLIGTSNHADTVQDHAKLKLAWEIAPGLKAIYLVGLWDNSVSRRPEGWLRDGSGAVVELTPENLPASGSRAINLDGAGYTLSAADFGRTRERLQQLMQGLALKRSGSEVFDWQLAASHYDYRRDEARAWAPSTGAVFNAQAGRLSDLGGTGWSTLDARAAWKGLDAHLVEFGLQRDAGRLRNAVSSIAEWTAGVPTSAPSSRFEGDTALSSAWLQDDWRFAPDWKAVIGLRAERWQADKGLSVNGNGPLAQFAHPARRLRAWSPKFALGWNVSDEGQLRLSSGRALRFPTVSELFQGGVNAATGALSNGDPGLRPEDSTTSELSADWQLATSRLRATLFHELTRDALYSQTNTTVTPNVSNIQNVDRVRTRGLELAAQASDWLWPGVDLLASLTFADSRITANARFPASVGRWQPRVPRWRASLVASWRAGAALTTTLGLRYTGRQFNSLDNSDPNGRRYQGASDFLVLDARLRWRLDRQWSAALGVDNLSNRVYWNFHPYPMRSVVGELRFDL